MNMRVLDSVERRQVVNKECRLIDRSNTRFAAWLKEYLAGNPSSWLGKGKKHTYWLVPISLVEDAIDVLAQGTDHCMLAQCYRPEGEDEDVGVLAIAPAPTPLQTLQSQVLGFLYALFIWMSDFWFHWGRCRCPNCFSTELHPFTFASEDEPASHYCNGCNTIWPPRK